MSAMSSLGFNQGVSRPVFLSGLIFLQNPPSADSSAYIPCCLRASACDWKYIPSVPSQCLLNLSASFGFRELPYPSAVLPGQPLLSWALATFHWHSQKITCAPLESKCYMRAGTFIHFTSPITWRSVWDTNRHSDTGWTEVAGSQSIKYSLFS